MSMAGQYARLSRARSSPAEDGGSPRRGNEPKHSPVGRSVLGRAPRDIYCDLVFTVFGAILWVLRLFCRLFEMISRILMRGSKGVPLGARCRSQMLLSALQKT